MAYTVQQLSKECFSKALRVLEVGVDGLKSENCRYFRKNCRLTLAESWTVSRIWFLIVDCI